MDATPRAIALKNSIGSFAANAALALAAWAGFYVGVGWLAMTVAVVVWSVLLIYLWMFFDLKSCIRAAGRSEPLPGWLWTGFDVLIAVELLAADAYLTGAGWVMSAVVYHLTKIRGRALARDAMQRSD